MRVSGFWRYPLLALVGLALVLPLLPLLIWSMAQGWYFPQWLPDHWSTQGWEAAFRSNLGRGFGQSLGIATLVTLLALLVGIPAGRALGTMDFPGRGLLKLVILLPVVVSPLTTLMGIQGVMIRLGWQGTILGVILVHLLPTVPYMTLVLSSVFAHYDPGYDQQARSLGATRWQVFGQVTWPLLLPGIAVSALFAFLISWNEFLLTFFVGGGEVLTLPMILFTLMQGGNNSLSAAVALTSILPALIFLLAVSRILNQDTVALGGFGEA